MYLFINPPLPVTYTFHPRVKTFTAVTHGCDAFIIPTFDTIFAISGLPDFKC